MKKINIRRIFTGILAVAVLLQIMLFAGISVSADMEVKTFGPFFAGDEGALRDGWHEIANVTQSVDYIYTLSYKIKADKASESGAVNVYGAQNISLGRYFPGRGFEGAYYLDGEVKKAKFSALNENVTAVNVWYIVETEWCNAADNRYMKYTVKNEQGEVLAESKKLDGLWCDHYYAAADAVANDAYPTGIYPWNAGTGADVMVKDVTVTAAYTPVYGEVFKYKFNSENDYDSRWVGVNQDNTKIVNGVLQIDNNTWPSVKIDADLGYYEFSYKVKASDACAGVMNVYENISGMNFGQYHAGTSIGVGSKDTDKDINTGYLTAAKNVWYTIKIAFSANEGEEYAKYTILDSGGAEVYKKTCYEIQRSSEGTFGTEVLFWNQGGGAFYYIDDVTLTKLEKPTVKRDSRILIDENFDSGIYDSAVWMGASEGVTVDNKTLQFKSGGYLYFSLPDKVKEKAYRITYDIKSDSVINPDKLGSLHMYGENNSADGETSNSNGMSMFSTKNGLYHGLEADLENRIPKYATGKGKVSAEKWYTVEIEFSETGGADNTGFIRMNLIDKETGRAVDEGFEVALGYASEQPNKTQYCLWSCSDIIGGTEYDNPDFYIDNFKVEELDMVYKRAVMKDLTGKDVTAYSGVTPLLSSIELLFSAPIDAESASGITLKKKSGEAVSFTGKTEGNKYILDLASALEDNTDYVLTVAKEVKAAGSDLTLTKASEMAFRTGTAQTTASFVNITPEKLTPSTEKIAVDIAAYNAGETALGMVVIAAFYNGDVMIDTKIQDLTVGVKEKLERKLEFDVSNSQITSSKLFIWNSLDEMLPYDKVRVIPYSAE